MRMGFGRLILLPLLASMLVLSLGAAIQAEESAWLGVQLQTIDSDLKEAMDLDEGIEGVLIGDVIDDSPADEYGIEDGDVILAIGDVKTTTIEEAVDAVRANSPGDEVDVVVLRGGKKKTIAVELGGQDFEMMRKKVEKFEFVMPGLGHLPEMGKQFAHGFMKPHGYLGVRVSEITEDLGDYFGVKGREGVLVLEVINDSPAEYAGLKEGDIILKVDGKELKGPDRLIKYMKKCEPGEEVEVTYKRKRRTRTVMVELEGAPGQGMPWFQKGHGKGDCGHKGMMMGGPGSDECMKKRMMVGGGKGGDECMGHGKHMMKMDCGRMDMSDCARKCMEKCKGMGLMGGEGERVMEIIGDDGEKKRIVIKTMGKPGHGGEGHKMIIKTEDGVKTIDLPNIDLSDIDIDLDLDDLEDLKGIHMYHLEAGDLEEEIEELQEDIEQLKKELEKLRKS